ncbi:MAG: transposase [Verrucomicrobiaceae bacterium]|nr:transposase [Verrucomicrobiaceae bacterium]
MKKSRHSEEKIRSILREAQGGMKVRDVCARHNISEQTYYGWKRKYGGMQVDELRQARALAEENGRLKRIVADLTVQIDILKAINAKMVSPASKRRAARYAMQSDLGGIAQVCRALELARSGYYRVAKVSAEARHRRVRIVRLSREHPRYGYRRIAALLRREGERINVKCVARCAGRKDCRCANASGGCGE